MYGRVFLPIFLNLNVLRIQGYNFSMTIPGEYNSFFYVYNLLEVYKDFHFVIHMDNKNMNYANALICHLEQAFGKSLTIFNYDEEGDYSFSRPYGIRFVNVIVLSNVTRFSDYSNDILNINLYDVVAFIMVNFRFDWRISERHSKERFKWQRGVPFWQILELRYTGKVIFVTIDPNYTVSLYNKCYYCGKQERYLKLLETSIAFKKPHISSVDIMPSKFNNLGKYRFKIFYLEFFPFLFCDKFKKREDNTEECVSRMGAEVELLKVMSKALNFRFDLTSDGTVFNESYSHHLHKVGDREVDFAIGGITLTTERSLLVTYTKPLRFVEYIILYMYHHPIWMRSKVVFYPFTVVVWIALTISIIAFSGTLCIFMKLNKRFYGKRISSTTEYLFIAVRSILEQPSLRQSNSIRTRASSYILLIILWFTCLEINTLYKSKLASLLVRPPYHEPESIEELLRNKYGLVAERRKLITVWDMVDQNDPLFLEAKKRLVELHNICEVIAYILEGQFAVLCEYSIAQHTIKHLCQDVFKNKTEESKLLRIAPAPVRLSQHGWALQLGAPYWRSFNKIIGRLYNGGLLEKWEKDTLRLVKQFKEIPRSNRAEFPRTVKISLSSYFSPFLIYVLGNILAIICFFAEIIVYRLKNWKIDSKLYSVIPFNKRSPPPSNEERAKE